MKTVLINKAQERIIKEILQHRKTLQEGIGIDGAGGVCCECDFDEDDYLDWLENDCGGIQDTPELRIEYVKDYCTFTIQYLDINTMHPLGGYETMSYDNIFEEFGEKLGTDIVNDCLDGKKHEYEFYEYQNNDEFDLSDRKELNNRAKNVMEVVDSPCGLHRGWILSDGTVLNAGWDHNACFKISPTQIKYREDFSLLGNVRYSNVSLEFGKYPTHEQLFQVREFCEYHSNDTIQVDFLGGKNGRVSKKYYGLDYNELSEDLYSYYTNGVINNRYQEYGIYESVEEKTLYHGSCADFDQFDEKYVLTGVGHMDFGYGFYLTTSKEAAHEYALGGKLYTVEVPDGKYLNSEQISRNEALTIARKFFQYYLSTEYGKEAYLGQENEFWEYECKYVAEATDGNSLYGSISSILGSDKDTSEYLRSLGYVGLEIETTNGTTGESFKNYLIFNQKDIKITGKTDF